MNPLLKYITIISLSVLISACGGGSVGTSDNVSDTSNRIDVTGSVGDGPVTFATVTLKNADGFVLATTTSNKQANYSISAEVQPDAFPLLLEASNGIDLVTGTSPEFNLLSIVPNRSSTHANLNPHSTMIIKTAKSMSGGLTDNNLELARKIIVTQLNFGLDTDLIDDPIAAKITSGNLPEITYASEALAEMIRRTSSVLGESESEESILNSLSADLADGKWDGKGSAGTNPQHTAVSKAVSLQVLLEAMLQDLNVNGVSAEKKLTDAINTVLGTAGKSWRTYRSKYIKWLMFKQARMALSAIQEIDPSVTLVDLMRVLKALGTQATTDEMVATLTQYGLDLSISNSLDSSIAQTVDASEEDIDSINTPADSIDDEESNQIADIPDNANNPPDDTSNDDEITTVTEDDSNNTAVIPAGNSAPSISGSPTVTLAEGEKYTFSVTATDPDGDDLVFGITNLPAWATFDSTTGTLSGIPGFSDAGLYETITITVTDGSARTSLNSFSIEVSNTNLPPSISGEPANSVTEGEAYLFIPQATDPDNDKMTFSVSKLPNWASFDETTGKLSGIPESADVGLYENIGISVSDGTATTALDDLSILVTANSITTGTADLAWSIPTTRTDGSPLMLSEIEGFKIYMGKQSDELNMILDLNESNITSHSVTNLTVGTYFFTITSYDTDGNESAFSNIAVKTIM